MEPKNIKKLDESNTNILTNIIENSKVEIDCLKKQIEELLGSILPNNLYHAKVISNAGQTGLFKSIICPLNAS